ncbi:MAG: hypothetical protein ACYTFT_06000 [Planctomycetota bacterium]
MADRSTANMRPLAPGVILALLAILFGFVLGGLFGAAEDSIKGHLLSKADAAFETAYDSNPAKRDAVVSKSWSYLKRAHLHGGAIGTAALASILLLGVMGSVGPLEKFSAGAFGAGSLLYACYWLAAGLTAPGLGSTGQAKEALEFMAIPGAGLCLLGLAGTLVSAIRQLVLTPAPAS